MSNFITGVGSKVSRGVNDGGYICVSAYVCLCKCVYNGGGCKFCSTVGTPDYKGCVFFISAV